MNKSSPEDLLDCGACGYDSCREHAVAIWQGLAEVEMCLPYAIEQLRHTVEELEESNRSLESTKEALVKSEKLASMGQLAAGIAHEVNNPLGILLLHANLLLEEHEGKDEVEDDLELIVAQANRCKQHHQRAAQLRPPEQGRPPAHRPRARWSTTCCAPSRSKTASRSASRTTSTTRSPSSTPTRSSRCSPT